MSKNETKKDKQVLAKLKATLPQVPEKYQQFCNLQYVRDEKSRNEVMALIDELRKIEGLVLEKTGGHDLSVRYKGRQLVKVCPLSRAWSASIQGSKIQRYSKNQILEQIRGIVNGSPKSASTGSALIKRLEDRIRKLSPKSKGISLKGVEVTKEVETWMKKNGYTMYDELLLVK